MAQLEKNLSEYDLDEMRKNESLKNFSAYKGFNKEIINTLIYRIEIKTNSDEITVILNFKDNFEKLQDMRSESEGIKDVC